MSRPRMVAGAIWGAMAAHVKRPPLRDPRAALGLLVCATLLALRAVAWADTTPAAFNFVDLTVADGGPILSNVVTVAGIDEPTPIDISGHASGEFRINGGAWRSAPATVSAGDRVRLRVTSRLASDPGLRVLTVD